MRNEFVLYLLDILQIIGPVNSRQMFGGYGIYLNGLMFGLVMNNVLYFKVAESNIKNFEAKGMEAFIYYKKGRPFKLLYYQVPPEVIEDIDEMVAWANSSYSVAFAASVARKK